jgi:hypothetical protein
MRAHGVSVGLGRRVLQLGDEEVATTFIKPYERQQRGDAL